MHLLLNLLWILLAGLWLFLGYFGLGIVFCITILGIPLGLVCMGLSLQMLMPFGKAVVAKPRATGALRMTLAVLWILIGPGLGLCMMHLFTGALLCITVVGIPLGIQNFKLMQIALLPLHFELKPGR